MNLRARLVSVIVRRCLSSLLVLVPFCLALSSAMTALGEAPVGSTELARTFNCYSVSQVPPVECEALVALYGSAGGNGWTNNDGWLVTDTPCAWYGVGCTAGHVTSLVLSYNGLSGSLPSELADLAGLQVLQVDSNHLTGSVPAELGTLASLRVLDLSFNWFSGGIPPQLGGLAALQSLSLQRNQFTGTIPVELGSLGNLVTFVLYHNHLSGPIPIEVGGLVNLQWLDLSYNWLSGTIPVELGGLTVLRQLSLGHNSL